MCANTGKHSPTLRASPFVQGSLALYCHQGLLGVSEYCMRQWATVVDQPPFFLVFNMADNTLDGLDVSGVQGPSLQVIWNWQHLIRVGEFSSNLLNNHKTNNLRLLHSKFFAFGNGDDDNI